MEKNIAKYESNVIESVVIGGDLSKLTPEQRVSYYKSVCDSIGLNPLTRPFDYITLNGKLTLYARKDATDQLRKIHDVSIDDVDIVENPTHFVVKVKGHDKTGRSDVEIGVVAKTDMQGNIGNAQMKAVTKGKRRLTLSLCGLGMLDETEIESIPTAQIVDVTDEGVIEEKSPELIKAENTTGADGKRYGDCTDKELHGKKIGLEKGLAEGKLDNAGQAKYQEKLEAIALILKSRSAGPTA